MIEFIENIWIIDFEGKCFFYKQVDITKPAMDEAAFSNFITAILMFTRDMFKEFNKLQLGGIDIFMQSFKEFFIVVSCKKELKHEKDLFKLINNIGKSFNDKFASVLKNQFASISTFEEFNPIMDKFFK